MLKKEMINYLIVHCSDTPDQDDLRATDIHNMHLGFGWDGAGYHHIICRDGHIEPGRPSYWQGAHVYGQNKNSLGVCLIGRQNFTTAQMNSLSQLLHHLKCQYPNAEIVGHRDVQNTAKTCPNFDVRSWWAGENLLNGQTAIVIAPVTGLYHTPPEHKQKVSVLDTELLSGEAVVLSGQTKDNGFVHITALHDGYQGWVKLAELAKPPEAFIANAKICQPFAALTTGPNVKSAYLRQLPFGASVMITGPEEKGYLPVMGLDDDGMILNGFIPKAQIQPDSEPCNEDWTDWAEKFIGAPYKWGGRSAAGLDCSALVQLSLAASRHSLPRDTGPQLQLLKKQTYVSDTLHAPFDDLTAGDFGRGDLIYWKEHVAICVDANAIIHANSFHNCVAIEPREAAFTRIAANFGPPIAHIHKAAFRQILPASDDF
tara:strand:+ start:2909 stop:4192 length:1284 start_codon:yes stop_codon:yes gene_type:complete